MSTPKTLEELIAKLRRTAKLHHIANAHSLRAEGFDAAADELESFFAAQRSSDASVQPDTFTDEEGNKVKHGKRLRFDTPVQPLTYSVEREAEIRRFAGVLMSPEVNALPRRVGRDA